MRYRKKQARELFELWCEQYGYRVAQSYNDVGALELDCNHTYGGYVINRISSKSGGISQPFGMTRKSTAEFCQCLYFSLDVLRDVRTAQKMPHDAKVIGIDYTGA